ncbi:MAG: hypothetical protein LBC18_16375 [Opitutaceae bacterium]|jgi:hypothetical protein|nr:hypothetical protein [Opitutaceae bacterium]
MNNIKTNIKPGQVYKCRNGATAKVLSAGEPGVRPIRAEIAEEGMSVPYARWYRIDGREFADGGESPYDLIALYAE